MNLTIIIPCHKEPKIELMIAETEKYFPEAQIIISNDRYSNGKGWAVRQGMQEATGDVICFIDGDLDIHPRMILRLLPFLDFYDVVVGKKHIRRSFARRMLTRLSRLYIKALFGMSIDTQTGIKIFQRYALMDWESDSFIFDLEILTKARNKGMQIIEVPVEVTDHGASCKPMKIRSIIRSLTESFKVWRVR